MEYNRKSIRHRILVTLIVIFLIIYMIPIYWILATSIKPKTEIFSIPPKFIFVPTLEHYRNLFVDKDTGKLTPYPGQLMNSVIVGFLSTFFSVLLGTLAGYAFSRFRVKGKNDWLFFILSTRMLPPIVVVIPVFLMYRWVSMHTPLQLIDTRTGLILLYTAFNVSFAVWLMKGFIEEIPRDYEEAAMVDGYTRFQAFYKVVLPQAVTGIAATAVFCLITAWNEFAFALVLTTQNARTAPPSIANMLGTGGLDWGRIAAGTVVFLLPVAIFTFLVRNHLLRGVTFGAIRR
jgi:multiple sugar transport system permease protein